jgi:hypothetical protein
MVAIYLLVCLSSCVVGSDGNGNPVTVGPNVVTNRILWDGVAPYTPPAGTRIIPDDGTPIGGTTSH